MKSPTTGLTHQYTAHPKLIKNPSVQLINDSWPLIRIYRFDEQDNTAQKLKNMVKKLQKQRKPLIIDLRYCPGGSFYAAVDALNWFLPKNLAVTHLKTAKANSLVTFQTLSGQIIKHQPIYLWVSPYTASAAEVFVRALQFYATNVTVVGTQTAGKCLSQQIMPLKDNSALVLSVYEILTPSEKSCQGQGIQPTIPIPPTEVLNDEMYKKYVDK